MPCRWPAHPISLPSRQHARTRCGVALCVSCLCILRPHDCKGHYIRTPLQLRSMACTLTQGQVAAVVLHPQAAPHRRSSVTKHWELMISTSSGRQVSTPEFFYQSQRQQRHHQPWMAMEPLFQHPPQPPPHMPADNGAWLHGTAVAFLKTNHLSCF